MPPFDYEVWAAPVASAIAVVGIVLVAWRGLRPPASRERRKAGKAGKAHELPCSACGHAMVFMGSELVPVSPTSKGLIVRSLPDLTNRRLAEYTCPSCDAVHCFITEGKTPPQWVGANLYQPGGIGMKCMECGGPVRKPPWPAGRFDGKIAEAPQITPETAMKCGRCNAVVCHACASRTSFGQLVGNAYRCPRCTRVGIEGFFHG